eukprot:6491007-Amphidinium_carterae.2
MTHERRAPSGRMLVPLFLVLNSNSERVEVKLVAQWSGFFSVASSTPQAGYIAKGPVDLTSLQKVDGKLIIGSKVPIAAK